MSDCREAIVGGDLALIPLGHDRFSIVSPIDSDLAKSCHWYRSQTPRMSKVNAHIGYARNGFRDHPQLMHRVILERVLGRGLSTNEHVDHIDGDGLNNMRSNLRLASISDNTANSNKYVSTKRNVTSKYKGVTFFRWERHHLKPWHARIYVRGKNMSLGYFATEIEAAKAYDLAAKDHFGLYAKCNRVKEQSEIDKVAEGGKA